MQLFLNSTAQKSQKKFFSFDFIVFYFLRRRAGIHILSFPIGRIYRPPITLDAFCAINIVESGQKIPTRKQEKRAEKTEHVGRCAAGWEAKPSERECSPRKTRHSKRFNAARTEDEGGGDAVISMPRQRYHHSLAAEQSW